MSRSKSLRVSRPLPMSAAMSEAATAAPIVMVVPLKDINADKGLNVVREDTRRQGDGGYGSIDELAASLESSGQLQPVVVRPAVDGKFELVFGFRRLLAAKKLGWKSVRAEIRDIKGDDKDWIQFQENDARHNLSSYERTMAIHRQHATHKWSVQKIAKSTGSDDATIQNHIRIVEKAAPDVLDRYRTGQFSNTLMLKIIGKLNKEQQREFCEKVGTRSGTNAAAALDEFLKVGSVGESEGSDDDGSEAGGSDKPAKADRPGKATLAKAFDWAQANKLGEAEHILGWVLGRKGYGGSKLTVKGNVFDPKAIAKAEKEAAKAEKEATKEAAKK
jgi:ParB/RepB/Spo0J family partition protein